MIRFPVRPVSATLAVVSLALLLVGSGCSTNPATGRTSFTGFMSPTEEKKVGADEHPKIIKEFGGEYSDPKVKAYVQRIGEQVTKGPDHANIKYTFTVLNSDVVNAFALPGGFVYVTRGLLSLASTEAELAGVLGHEAGHVVARHTAERYSAAVLSEGAVTIGATLLSILTGSSAAGQAAGQLGGAGAGMYLAGYSRSQETEADRLGVRYLVQGGYDDEAMASFLSKLQAESALAAEISGRPGAENEFSVMQTHPRTADRVQDAIAEAKREGLDLKNPRVGADDHLNAINGMSWGGDRDSGWVRDRLFIHPGLRFRFEVPQGFQVVNGESSVTAAGPDKSRIIFSVVPQQAAGTQAPIEYLRKVTFEKSPLQGIEAIEINGLTAATGNIRATTNAGAMDIRVVAVRAETRMYRFLFISPQARAAELSTPFRQTTYSFRSLTAQEAQAAQPPRIRVVTVGANDTVESMARRMSIQDRAAQRFRVLNGLAANEQSRAGTRVKIIAD